jgi:glycosyltransferase involved in cell wall biosynthesis
VIPTFLRPDGARASVESVFAQTGVALSDVEVVLVDNDPAGSAAGTAAALAAVAPVAFTAVHEPRAGVSHARNTGVATARAPLIAFLDDDETATPGWLAALLAAQEATGADVVFGPIETVLPEPAPEPRAHFEAFFARIGPDRVQRIDQPFGCGNSLMVRASVLNDPAPFDVGHNELGGEDDVLFRRVAASGGTFGWAPQALVREVVPPHRATWSYVLRRAFTYGHNTTAQYAEGESADPLRLAGWMLRGAVQALAMGALGAMLWAVRHPRRAWAIDKAARGAGKALWFGPFRQRLYGAASPELAARKRGAG